jgi:hypothetical protein
MWFANPLYMNDLDGMRSGIILGSQIFPGFFYNISAFAFLDAPGGVKGIFAERSTTQT